MLDLFYDLSPDEDLADIDGHLLVLVMDSSALSLEFGRVFHRRIRRLDDASEFHAAMVRSVDFHRMQLAPDAMPALFHFLGGRQKHMVTGVDDCEDFLEEFIENNRCKKCRKRL